MQLAGLVQCPDFLSVLGVAEPGIKPAEVVLEVLYVPQKQSLTVSIVGRVGSLWKVDDDWTIARHENVVFGQISVDHAGTQHAHALPDQVLLEVIDLGLGELYVPQPGSRLAMLICDQLHQQYVVAVMEGGWHPDAGFMQSIQRADFSLLPLGLNQGFAVLGPFGHRSLLARVSYLATLRVVCTLTEAPIVGVFVYLRDALALAGLDQVHRGLFPTHERAGHGQDEPVVVQRKQGFRNIHSGLCRSSGEGGWDVRLPQRLSSPGRWKGGGGAAWGSGCGVSKVIHGALFCSPPALLCSLWRSLSWFRSQDVPYHSTQP